MRSIFFEITKYIDTPFYCQRLFNNNILIPIKPSKQNNGKKLFKTFMLLIFYLCHKQNHNNLRYKKWL